MRTGCSSLRIRNGKNERDAGMNVGPVKQTHMYKFNATQIFLTRVDGDIREAVS